MTLLLAVRVLLLKFNLDEYTSWWNSPQAALYFWGGFVLVALIVAGILTLWVMRTRSVK